MTKGEMLCLLLFFAYIAWVPLPFASTPAAFQLPLIVPGLAICALTAIVLAAQRARPPVPASRAHELWTGAALLFILVVAIQVVPLPAPLLRVISPESARIWSSAGKVVSLVRGTAVSSSHPISIDPSATTLHLLRLLVYFATFTTAAFLIRRHAQRVAFAVLLSLCAFFQTFYAIHEAALNHYSIWGWRNNLIFDRATGTFVNPNHFAHYAAILLPMGAFFAGCAWHDAAPTGTPLRKRFLRLIERRLPLAAFGMAVIVACVASILIARSRGALLAMIAGCAIGAAAATRRRIARSLLVFVAAIVIVAGVAAYLGPERTSIGRLIPSSADIQGRRAGIEIALAIWRRFPLLGSGLGTFIDLAPTLQPREYSTVFNHAHNDYVEVLATTGAVGFLVLIVPLALGLRAFLREAFKGSDATSYRRRAFHAAVFASIATALVHACFDFNFFIPANAVTLAAMAGAIVATRSESSEERDSSLDDSRA
jgi:O-antigen ligase